MASSGYHPGTSLTFIVSILSLCAMASAVEFAGGTGEPNDPYQIATAEQLVSIGSDPNLLDKHFVLIADIDLDPKLPSGRTFEQAVIAPVAYWASSQTAAFTGCLNGQGHTIGHLAVSAYCAGLIGQVGPGGHIVAVNLENADIFGGGYTGSLAGKMDGGIVEDCCSSGSVLGVEDYVGGLVGAVTNAVVVGSHTSCEVAGFDWPYVGGLVGRNTGGTLSNCSATGEVWGQDRAIVGGLVGWNVGGFIRSCCSTGSVHGEADVIGGLVGSLEGGVIRDCYASGDVFYDEHVWNIGGLVGESALGRIERSYASGALIVGEYGVWWVGGLVAENKGTQVHGIWNTKTSGQWIGGGGMGLDTDEMIDPATYGLNGWAGDPNWVMQAGDYPRLAWEGTSGSPIPNPVLDWLTGRGTSDAPYQITCAHQLVRLGTASALWDRHFILAADLDLKDVVLRPLGLTQGMEFQGQFSGAGHILRNLSAGTLDHAVQGMGLFGGLGANARVDDLGLKDVQVLAADSGPLGAIAGLNQGSISRCFATGAIKMQGGCTYLGGLVGINEGLIEDCYAQVESGPGKTGPDAWYRTDYCGGLVGSNWAGRVSRCYATGWVTSPYQGGYVGGLIGCNTGQVLWSLWDAKSSGWGISDGGLGFDTVQMKDANTYALNGWAEAPDWVIQTTVDYPRLAWEGRPGAAVPRAIVEGLQGQGTSDDPYRVIMASDLAMIAKAACLWDKCFVLEADLDLADTVCRPIGAGGGMDFSGSFAGQRYTLRNLLLGSTKDRAVCAGLFGCIGKTGAIRNLTIEGGRMAAGAYSAGLGLLAGRNAGDIENCHADGTVTAEKESSDVGGLVGSNSGTLLSCTADAEVAGTGNITCVGQLAGTNSGAIHLCAAAGTVAALSELDSSSGGGSDVGGLVGRNTGVIGDCQSFGNATGYQGVGGLCGDNLGILFHGEALGSVTCDQDSGSAGGLTGYNSSGLVMMCSATGPVLGGGNVSGGSSAGVGGLAGCNYGIIDRSSAGGEMVASYSGAAGGGLLGQNAGGITVDCYSEGTVLAMGQYASSGGLVGTHSGIIMHGYASGSVLGSSAPGRMGGLVGYGQSVGTAPHAIEAGFFLSPNDGGGPDNGFGTPLTAQQMRNIESFAGWDFFGRSSDGDGDVWFMPQGRPPVLTWQASESGLAVVPNVVGLTLEQACEVLKSVGFQAGVARTDFDRVIPAGRGIGTRPMFLAPAGAVVDVTLSAGPYAVDENPGDGSAENPYQIATEGQLEALADHPELWGRCFVLTGDIDLSGRSFSRALIAPDNNASETGFQGEPFSGHFDGAGHTICHFDIASATNDYLGLFGRIDAAGHIVNLYLAEVRIAAGYSGTYAGPIAGHLQGTLTGCYAQGLVCASYVGGPLVGLNEGTLSDCSSQVLVVTAGGGRGR
jgi:hypothetical protein